MSVMSRLWGVTAAIVLLGGMAGAPAQAAVVSNMQFTDSGSEPITDCAGIDAVVSWEDRVHELIKTKGSAGLVYFAVNVHGTATFTNLDTQKTYTNVYNFSDRDQRITDNGDGTLTITISSSGSGRWYGSDGKLLFVTAGSFRAEFMVDHGGTPTDPSDDKEIPDSFVVLREAGLDQTAGRDFCADLAEFTA